MPHCVIEISNQLSSSVTPTQLLRCVFDAHVKSGLFETDHIKVRCTSTITIHQVLVQTALSTPLLTLWQAAL